MVRLSRSHFEIVLSSPFSHHPGAGCSSLETVRTDSLELLFPSDDIRPVSPVIPGLSTPSTFPSRGFSPPQGLTPHFPLRFCFTPLPPIGFPPSELSPPNQPRPSPAPSPHDITPLSSTSPFRPMATDLPIPRCWPLRAHLVLTQSWSRCPLGFAPAQRPFISTRGLVPTESRCSPGVLLLQGPSSRWTSNTPPATLSPFFKGLWTTLGALHPLLNFPVRKPPFFRVLSANGTRPFLLFRDRMIHLPGVSYLARQKSTRDGMNNAPDGLEPGR